MQASTSMEAVAAAMEVVEDSFVVGAYMKNMWKFPSWKLLIF